MEFEKLPRNSKYMESFVRIIKKSNGKYMLPDHPHPTRTNNNACIYLVALSFTKG